MRKSQKPAHTNPFLQFPKQRKPLPQAYQAIYEKHYIENRGGKTKASFLASKLESWLHYQVAKSAAPDLKTLEIGAGTLNQLQYEKTQYYDIVEPFEILYKTSPYLSRINNIFADLKDITQEQMPQNGYDRIISIATFEHITDLPTVVAKTCTMLNPNGTLHVSIPNEGRYMWELAYTLTTGAEFKKRYGLDYKTLMQYEHCNTADEIEDILKYFYKNVQTKLFGFSKSFALYRYYCCRL